MAARRVGHSSCLRSPLPNMPTRYRNSPINILPAAVLVCCAFGMGCDQNGPSSSSSAAQSVVVYVSVDRAFAEPLLTQFAERSGLNVKPVFDTEASKTTGLVNRLRTEKDRPRADVWWSSEIFGTIELAQEGIFEPYLPATAADIPDTFKANDDLWTAFGLRGRVLALRRDVEASSEPPSSWWDLTDARFKDRCVFADPRFGTTRGHMATLLSEWGEDNFRAFLKGLKANGVKRATGNSHAVILVRRGVADWGATDTDDVVVGQARGDAIDMVYPTLALPKELRNGTDRATDRLNAPLWIPCSVALVKGARNKEAAKKLIDLICSADTERALYESESRNIPVRSALRKELGIEAPPAAQVDYTAAALRLDDARRIIDEVAVFE